MSRRTGSALALAALLAAPAAGAAVRVSAEVDRNPVHVGEGFELTITVAGTMAGAREPDLPASVRSAFDVYSSGTSRQMTLSGGVSEGSITYRYTLVAHREGEVAVPAISIGVGGDTYETQPFVIDVVPAGASGPPRPRAGTSESAARPDEIRLVASVDKDHVVEGEEIVLSISFFHRSRLIDRPEFEPPQTTGFVTERLPDGSMRDEVIDGVRYTVQELRYALFPLGAGTKRIGEARVTATVPRGRRRDPFSVFGSWFDGRPVAVESEPLLVRVDPLPPTDDAAFTGAVGSFRMQASIDVEEVDQNDPVTLTIEINGIGNLGSAGEISAPDTDRFRVFDAASEMTPQVIGGKLGGARTIQRAFVPLEAGQQEIPRVRFTYFDPSTRAYRTLTAGPFPILVRPRESSGAPFVVGKGEVRRLDEDIRFIHTVLGRVHESGSGRAALGWLAHAAPLALVGAALARRRRRERLATDVAYARSRRALSRARRTLAAEAPKSEGARAWSALSGYVADRLDAPDAAMTGIEAERLLVAAGAPPALARDVRVCAETCDFERYAPGGERAADGELRRRVTELLGALESIDLRRPSGEKTR